MNMNQFFSSLYCNLFEDLFGQDLAMYLNKQIVFLQQGNMFVSTAFMMMCVSLFITVTYYYIIDHPKLADFSGWFMFMCICVVANYLTGWLWVRDIGLGSSLGFGITNGILSIPAFIIMSFLSKWYSHNCLRTPL